MKKTILIILILICPFIKVNGQIYIGGNIGYTIEIPPLLSRISTPHGLITSAEIRKLFGKYGFSIDFNQMRYNQYINGTDYNAIKTITIPLKINFDYHFIGEKKLSPYIGLGVGLAHSKTLNSEYINGVASTIETSGASNCYNLRGGMLLDTKFGKLNFNFNYFYLPNQLFDAKKRINNKEFANILSLGVGYLFKI